MAFTSGHWKNCVAGLHMDIDTIGQPIQDNQDALKSNTAECVVCTQNKASQKLVNLHEGGSGIRWFYADVTTTEQTVDNSIVWFNRQCIFKGTVRGTTGNYYPGAANDNLIDNTIIWDHDGSTDNTVGMDNTSEAYVKGIWYSGEGSKGPDFEGLPNYNPNIMGMVLPILDGNVTNSVTIYLYVNEIGELVVKRGTDGDNVDMTINGGVTFSLVMR